MSTVNKFRLNISRKWAETFSYICLLFAIYFILFWKMRTAHKYVTHLRFEIYFRIVSSQSTDSSHFSNGSLGICKSVISLSLSKYFDCQTAGLQQGSIPNTQS